MEGAGQGAEEYCAVSHDAGYYCGQPAVGEIDLNLEPFGKISLGLALRPNGLETQQQQPAQDIHQNHPPKAHLQRLAHQSQVQILLQQVHVYQVRRHHPIHLL